MQEVRALAQADDRCEQCNEPTASRRGGLSQHDIRPCQEVLRTDNAPSNISSELGSSGASVVSKHTSKDVHVGIQASPVRDALTTGLEMLWGEVKRVSSAKGAREPLSHHRQMPTGRSRRRYEQQPAHC